MLNYFSWSKRNARYGFVFAKAWPCFLGVAILFSPHTFARIEVLLQTESYRSCVKAFDRNCASPLTQTAKESMKMVCEQRRQELKCEQLKAFSPESEKKKFYSCETPEGLCFQADTNKVAQIYSCGKGAATVVIDVVLGIILAPIHLVENAHRVTELPRIFRECHEDFHKKIETLNVFRPKDMTDETIRRMDCADINKFVQTKVNVLNDRIEQKRQNEMLKTGQENLTPLDLDLTKEELYALNHQLIHAGPLQKAQCYNPLDAAKLACSILTKVSLDVAGLSSGVKLLGWALKERPVTVVATAPEPPATRGVTGAVDDSPVSKSPAMEPAKLVGEAPTTNFKDVPAGTIEIADDLRLQFAAATTVEERIQLVKTLQEMNEIKSGAVSPTQLKRLVELNDEALYLMQEILARKGIKSEIRTSHKFEPRKRLEPLKEMEAEWSLENVLLEIESVERRIALEADQLARLKSSIKKSEATLQDWREWKFSSDNIKFLEDSISSKKSELIEHRTKQSELQHLLEELEGVRSKKIQNAKDLTEQNVRKFNVEEDQRRTEYEDLTGKNTGSEGTYHLKSDSVIGTSHALYNKQLRITSVPPEMVFLDRVSKKFGVEYVLSPNRLQNSRSQAAVSYDGKTMYLPYDFVLEPPSPRIGANPSGNHEVLHLALQAQRRAGIETPYQMEIKARPGHKVGASGYEGFMSFEELSTFSHAISQAQKPNSRSITTLSNGQFAEFTPEYRGVSAAQSLKEVAEAALTATDDVIRIIGSKDVGRVKFKIKGEGDYTGNSQAVVPIIRNGQEIGDATIDLVKLNATNSGRRVQMLSEYLERISLEAERHLFNATDYLMTHPAPPLGQELVPLN